MSVSGSGVNFQIDILGDRASSVYVIDLAKDPVVFYSDALPTHGVAKYPPSFDLSGSSSIVSLELLSYDEPGVSITSHSLSGTVLTVTFNNAVGASSSPPIPMFHLIGRLLVS